MYNRIDTSSLGSSAITCFKIRKGKLERRGPRQRKGLLRLCRVKTVITERQGIKVAPTAMLAFSLTLFVPPFDEAGARDIAANERHRVELLHDIVPAPPRVLGRRSGAPSEGYRPGRDGHRAWRAGPDREHSVLRRGHVLVGL